MRNDVLGMHRDPFFDSFFGHCRPVFPRFGGFSNFERGLFGPVRSMDDHFSDFFHDENKDTANVDDADNARPSCYSYSSCSTYSRDANGEVRRTTKRKYKDSSGREKSFEDRRLGRLTRRALESGKPGETQTEENLHRMTKETDNAADAPINKLTLEGASTEEEFLNFWNTVDREQAALENGAADPDSSAASDEQATGAVAAAAKASASRERVSGSTQQDP
jgi:hypothetical protein